MGDSDKRHCKDCGELKTRIEDGKYNSKDKRYKDENGKLWNGNRCGSCVVKRSREHMQQLRTLRKGLAT